MRRKQATAAQLKNDAALVSLLRNAVEAASDDDGWAPLSAVGNILTNQRPDFDSRLRDEEVRRERRRQGGEGPGGVLSGDSAAGPQGPVSCRI